MFAKLFQWISLYKTRDWCVLDSFVILCFLFFAIIFHVGRICAANPIVDLRSDCANIASFCAGLDNPDLFEGDMLLEDSQNFRLYMTIHIPLIRVINKVTNSYAKASLALLGAHIFLFLTGFYLLGKLLLKSRFWALLFVMVMATFVPSGWGTYWGIFTDPMPLFTYASLLGFLWYLAIYFYKSPKNWPWIMCIAGILVYVHPVSAPAIAFSLWFGYCWFLPNDWNKSKKLLYMFFCGIVFLLVATPFILNYLTNHKHGIVGNYTQILEAMKYRLIKGYISDYSWAIKTFLVNLTLRPPIIPLGIFGLLVMFSCPEWRKKNELKLIILWLLGIVLCVLIFFGGDHIFAKITGRIPVQFDLIRCIRFTIPILLTFFIMGLVCIENNAQNWMGKRIVNIGIITLVVYIMSSLMFAKENLVFPIRGIKAMIGRYEPSLTPKAEAIKAVTKLTPPNSKIIVYGFEPQVIRYAAIRPVVFNEKDGGVFAYANHEKLLKWHQISKRLKKLNSLSSTEERTKDFLQLSHELNAEYLLVSKRLNKSNSLSPEGKRIKDFLQLSHKRNAEYLLAHTNNNFFDSELLGDCLWSNAFYSLYHINQLD